MAGKHIGKEREIDKPKHIESAEELFGIMSGAGLNVGIIHQKKQDGVAYGSR